MTFAIAAIGLLAQLFYTARILVQWVMSERAHRVVSPTLFWLCSLIGSMLLFLYGYLRADFSILFGELLSYYIYMWNLQAKGFFASMPEVHLMERPIALARVVPTVLTLLPVVTVASLATDYRGFAADFLLSEELPPALLLWGMLGQLIYKMRFVYQWWYSYRRGQSLLPRTFWMMAVVGSLIIISYAIIRHDWILLLGQVGIVASVRNLIIGHRAKTRP